MDQTIRQMARAIVAREGGYVNDPDDPGGATNFGVTIGTMRRLGLDLDGDGAVTPRDVRALSRDQAVELFVDQVATELRGFFENADVQREQRDATAPVADADSAAEAMASAHCKHCAASPRAKSTTGG